MSAIRLPTPHKSETDYADVMMLRIVLSPNCRVTVDLDLSCLASVRVLCFPAAVGSGVRATCARETYHDLPDFEVHGVRRMFLALQAVHKVSLLIRLCSEQRYFLQSLADNVIIPNHAIRYLWFWNYVFLLITNQDKRMLSATGINLVTFSVAHIGVHQVGPPG